MTDTAPRPRGRPGTSADTRDRLVAAAVEVFLERGYADTRVQDITEAAGFTTGALYAHFNSRMEILADAVLTEGERLVGELADRIAVSQTENGGPGRRMAELLTEPTRTVDRLMLEAITMATREPEARDTIIPALTRIRDQLTSTMSEARLAGAVDDNLDPEAASLMGLSIMLGAVIIRALDLPRADTENVTALVRRASGATG
ncbi:MAG: TetR/AcrR family transcriptional regulator [Microthrixaceae bacterium]